MKYFGLFSLLSAVLILFSCSGKDSDKGFSKSESDYSYAIGVQVGRNLKDADAPISIKSLLKGVEDGFNDKSDMNEQEIMKAVAEFSRIVNQKSQLAAQNNYMAGTEFLENNKTKPGVHVTESGLQYIIVKEGKGRSPRLTDSVKVHYRGKLIDGTEFDSSYARNKPVEFELSGVIRGWSEILQIMKPGSSYKLFVPSELAYGSKQLPQIPANSVLIFDIELLEILKAQK